MRLIDADALREEVDKKKVVGRFNTLLLIDNAPTVDIKDEIAGAYNEGYMCGNKEAEKGRPQGEWKEYKLRNDIVVEYAFKCSNCKKDSGLLYRANFCPNCGADMRGGAE